MALGLAADLRVRVGARRGVGAPRAPPVRPHAVRNERLGALPVRALCVPASAAPSLRVAVRPGAAGLAGDAGGQRAPLPAAVRAVGRGYPRAPERRGSAPRRRDQLAGAGATPHMRPRTCANAFIPFKPLLRYLCGIPAGGTGTFAGNAHSGRFRPASPVSPARSGTFGE